MISSYLRAPSTAAIFIALLGCAGVAHIAFDVTKASAMNLGGRSAGGPTGGSTGSTSGGTSSTGNSAGSTGGTSGSTGGNTGSTGGTSGSTGGKSTSPGGTSGSPGGPSASSPGGSPGPSGGPTGPSGNSGGGPSGSHDSSGRYTCYGSNGCVYSPPPPSAYVPQRPVRHNPPRVLPPIVHVPPHLPPPARHAAAAPAPLPVFTGPVAESCHADGQLVRNVWGEPFYVYCHAPSTRPYGLQ